MVAPSEPHDRPQLNAGEHLTVDHVDDLQLALVQRSGAGGAAILDHNADLSRPDRKIAPSDRRFGTAPAARASPRTAATGGDPVRQTPDRHQVHATRVHQAGGPAGSPLAAPIPAGVIRWVVGSVHVRPG